MYLILRKYHNSVKINNFPYKLHHWDFSNTGPGIFKHRPFYSTLFQEAAFVIFVETQQFAIFKGSKLTQNERLIDLFYDSTLVLQCLAIKLIATLESNTLADLCVT